MYFLTKLLLAFENMYLILRFMHLSIYTTETLMNKSVHFLWTSCFVLVGIINVNMVGHPESLKDFTNHLVFATRLFEGKVVEAFLALYSIFVQ